MENRFKQLFDRFDQDQGKPPAACLVIAEVAQSHDGSLGVAHSFIDAISACGADAVKFQTHIAEAESTAAEPWRVQFSPQDRTRYDYWRRMEFSEEQWLGLAMHAKEKGLEFLSSPFSYQAVELLERVGVPAWKVGSGEVGNLPLVDRLARTGLPVLLSSGMSSWDELDAAVNCVRSQRAPVATFQCTSAYPCPPEKTGLNLLAELRARYNCPVGLSDHSASIYAGLAAATLGADLIEVHITFSRESFGPDVPSSITVAELKQLVEGVRFIQQALSPVDKESMAEELSDLRLIFNKSIVAAHDLAQGVSLTADDLAFKKPGTGIPPNHLGAVVGKQLVRPLKADALIELGDLK
jgi:N,N'-diacetyllegionaminate synthase